MKKTPEVLTNVPFLPAESGRGSVRIRDRFWSGVLAFSATILAVQAGAILVSQFTNVPMQEAQRYASCIALPAAIVSAVSFGAGRIGALRRFRG